jgi:hypothetical protein
MALLGFLRRKAPTSAAPIIFFVRLDSDDWDDNQGAWRCSALRLPAVEVSELRSQGNVLPSERYTVDTAANQIRWIGRDVPRMVSVRVTVSQALVTAEAAEDEKRNSATRVATIGALATVFAAGISGGATYYAKRDSPQTTPVQHVASPDAATAVTTSAHPRSQASVESIPFDAQQVISSLAGKSCVISNAGLFPYCNDSSVSECQRDVAKAGGPFAAHHRCVAPPRAVYCGAYRSSGGVRTICYSSQEQCDVGRLSYRVVPNIDAVSDSCREVSIRS